MDSFVTSFGLPGAVILSLVGVLLWVVRKFFTGDVVSRKVHEDRMTDRDETIRDLRKTVDNLTRALQNLAVVGQGAAYVVRSVEKVIEQQAAGE